MANIFKKIKTGTKDRWQSSLKDFGHTPNVIAGGISTVPKAANVLYQLTPQATINRQLKKLVDPSLKNESFSQRNKRFSQKVDSLVEPLGLRGDKVSRTMYDLGNIAGDVGLSMIPANAISKISWLSKLPKYSKGAAVLGAQLAIPTFSANEQVLAGSDNDVLAGSNNDVLTGSNDDVLAGSNNDASPAEPKASKKTHTNSKGQSPTISNNNIDFTPYNENMNIEKVLTFLPEDQRESARAKLENMPKAQRDVLLARLSPLMKTQGGSTNTETTVSGSTPAGTSTFPKNNPMGNKQVGTFEGKPVYKNSKGQNYYFTGKGGAAIIGGDKITAVTEVDPMKDVGNNSSNNIGYIAGAAVGAGAGTVFWLDRLKKIRESLNNKAPTLMRKTPALVDKTRRYVPETSFSNLGYDSLKTKLKPLMSEIKALPNKEVLKKTGKLIFKKAL